MPAQTPELGAWLDGLAHDPDVLVHQLDTVNRRLLLVRLPAGRIRDTAFLDQRVLEGLDDGAWIPLEEALRAGLPDVAPAGLILHCGHAGSTLVSRLLGELPATRVLREPLLLQALASEARVAGTPLARLGREEFAATLALARRTLAKAPPDAPRVVIKHTSLTANLAPVLREGAGTIPVLCLWIPLSDYLAAMLREPALRAGARAAAGEWIRDLLPVLGAECPVLGECGDAQLVALNWCAAQLAFARAREGVPGHQVIGRDFDTFLADPETQLQEFATLFGMAPENNAVERALCSPWLRRYAKDPRYPFDAQARKRELDAAKTRLGAEIREGLAFARRLWPRLPLEQAFARPE